MGGKWAVVLRFVGDFLSRFLNSSFFLPANLIRVFSGESKVWATKTQKWPPTHGEKRRPLTSRHDFFLKKTSFVSNLTRVSSFSLALLHFLFFLSFFGEVKRGVGFYLSPSPPPPDPSQYSDKTWWHKGVALHKIPLLLSFCTNSGKKHPFLLLREPRRFAKKSPFDKGTIK